MDSLPLLRRKGAAMGRLSSYDVWHTRYYSGATFTGDFEMPVIEGSLEKGMTNMRGLSPTSTMSS